MGGNTFRSKIRYSILQQHRSFGKKRKKGSIKIALPKHTMYMEYLPTFTMNLCQIWANMPYMEHLGLLAAQGTTYLMRFGWDIYTQKNL